MKRILVLALALCLVFALAGCVVTNGKSSVKLCTGTVDTEFAALSLDVDVADVTIEPGDAWHIEYGLGHEPVIETLDDGTLSIRENAPENWWEDFHFGSANQPYVKVTVPADADVNGLDIHVDVGNVKLSQLKVGAIDLYSDVGDLTVQDAEVLFTAGLNVDVGNIDCRQTTVGSGILLDVDTGNVTFEGSAKSVQAESDVGDVKLLLPGTASDWAMTLETDTGSVIVDGNDQGKRLKLETVGGTNVLIAESDVGDVEVEFQG